ncbi:MAG: DUF3833 family protein [Pseudomonadota bacterium]|nr:DUF3833 family protein [Pseudomonadota bacterium]MEC8515868.1 DUF3833 family protein [Pseudomonadota bacterium]
MADSLIIPTFEPESYFAGRLDAYGVFVDRFGSIQRQFEVVVEGRKTDTGFSLDEYFLYDDGEREERRWDVTALGNGRYEGRCRDVIGVARGVCTANMLSWKYRFRLEMFGRKVAVTFDDVMVLQAGGVLVNRATVSKAGLKLGEVLLTFRPS